MNLQAVIQTTIWAFVIIVLYRIYEEISKESGSEWAERAWIFRPLILTTCFIFTIAIFGALVDSLDVINPHRMFMFWRLMYFIFTVMAIIVALGLRSKGAMMFFVPTQLMYIFGVHVFIYYVAQFKEIPRIIPTAPFWYSTRERLIACTVIMVIFTVVMYIVAYLKNEKEKI